ncbi:MAG: endonuclease [Bacteroidales bacterium]|nr:endonuclease [Bacteroidales bacterium]
MIRAILCLVIFWNVENYFDPFNDSSTNDGDFTPQGYYSWTWRKFLKKRNDIAKTLIACGLQEDGTWEAPCIIGLCEIENYFVLHRLVTDSPLDPLDYGIIHRDSPDHRGIDVALLYRKEAFTPLKTVFYALTHEDGTPAATREILYVKGVYKGRDTLHFFVNHWPSKLGGSAAKAMRMKASETLQLAVDSLMTARPGAGIIVMGDFNDSPKAQAIRRLESEHLTNVSAGDTYKFQGAWECIDQFLVSPSVQQSLVYVKVVRLPFLLEPDATHMGLKPRRTYLGPAYKGGISDHLPISLKIINFTGHVKTARKHPIDETVLCH